MIVKVKLVAERSVALSLSKCRSTHLFIFANPLFHPSVFLSLFWYILHCAFQSFITQRTTSLCCISPSLHSLIQNTKQFLFTEKIKNKQYLTLWLRTVSVVELPIFLILPSLFAYPLIQASFHEAFLSLLIYSL